MAGEKVSIFEVGVRDGLQNESRPVTLEDKLKLAQGLIDAGITDFELGAFVREDRVPQMADTSAVFEAIRTGKLKLKKARAWSLVPNRRGLERAIAAGAKRIAIFTAASDTFNRKNIGMSIKESLLECREVIQVARKHKIYVRGYVSTCFGCPYEGKIAPRQALRVINKLAELGVTKVSIGDTIGVATPFGVDQVVKPAFHLLGKEMTAIHFHDTRGTALANTLRSIEHGVRTIDSSVGGLGGCPFAPGATGNLATEDLVYMLNGMKFRSGIDLERLSQVSLEFARRIKRPISSRYLQAFATGTRFAS